MLISNKGKIKSSFVLHAPPNNVIYSQTLQIEGSLALGVNLSASQV
jgi:hypothetical protein